MRARATTAGGGTSLTTNSSRPSIVLIDDDSRLLSQLRDALDKHLLQQPADIRTWIPEDGQEPLAELERLVDRGTLLVVTDFDLTKAGLTGMFGVTVVTWCQAHSVPVGDFSRKHVANLPREPNLFELRVPTDIETAATYAAGMYLGFKELRDLLEVRAAEVADMQSPAEVLASLLGHPELEGQFAQYMSRISASNAFLLEQLSTVAQPDAGVADGSRKRQLLAYIIGHVLANAVLRYPGPILSEKALCAYVSTVQAEAASVGEAFRDARYTGPFAANGPYFWRSEVDRVIEGEGAQLGDASFDTFGEYNRAVVEAMLKRRLATHECPRCGGRNGGYLCPLTGRTVCERADCSVAANSWIPAGADVCRIEKDYYDEWAPLLGA
jgi:hypothetical protein